jgi:hypothetical protein
MLLSGAPSEATRTLFQLTQLLDPNEVIRTDLRSAKDSKDIQISKKDKRAGNSFIQLHPVCDTPQKNPFAKNRRYDLKNQNRAKKNFRKNNQHT